MKTRLVALLATSATLLACAQGMVNFCARNSASRYFRDIPHTTEQP